MRLDPVRIVCSFLFALALAASSPAAEPPPAAGDVGTMTMRQLLAEFNGPAELSRPVSQRRVDVINALRRLGPPLIDAMRAELGNGDPEARVRALRVLLSLGNKARPLLPGVVVAATDNSPGVRSVAVQVLCQLRDPRAFDVLMQAARDPDAGVRSSVIRNGRAALADAPFTFAVGALTDADVHVRVTAVQELRWLKDKRAVAHLSPLLSDQTVLHHDVRNGVKTTHRMCDEAVEALEYLVNGVYLLPGDKTQTDYDDLVERWHAWSKEKGQRFDEALYEEPELKKAGK
jgi:HEAT repeat protein